MGKLRHGGGGAHSHGGEAEARGGDATRGRPDGPTLTPLLPPPAPLSSAVGTPRPPRPPGLLLLCAWLLPLLGGAGVRGEAEPSALPEDAAQEHGYYLQQLFGLYGANGTLPSAGLARLLGSLGLGRVQVVRIQHEEMGHGHVSHLDLLEVQEERHRHRHPAWEHGSGEAARDRPPRCPPGTPSPGAPPGTPPGTPPIRPSPCTHTPGALHSPPPLLVPPLLPPFDIPPSI